MPQTDGTIWFVDDEGGTNRLTFGFTTEGEMTWVALGRLRENGWTCGLEENSLAVAVEPNDGFRPRKCSFKT